MPKQLTEAECLTLIDDMGEDAYDLLLEHMPSAEKRFKAVDKAICDLLRDVKKHFPDACYYTASGGFNLMLGASHDKRGVHGQQQLIALSGRAEIGDGDF
jgi:hypothetical protein